MATGSFGSFCPYDAPRFVYPRSCAPPRQFNQRGLRDQFNRQWNRIFSVDFYIASIIKNDCLELTDLWIIFFTTLDEKRSMSKNTSSRLTHWQNLLRLSNSLSTIASININKPGKKGTLSLLLTFVKITPSKKENERTKKKREKMYSSIRGTL